MCFSAFRVLRLRRRGAEGERGRETGRGGEEGRQGERRREGENGGRGRGGEGGKVVGFRAAWSNHDKEGVGAYWASAAAGSFSVLRSLKEARPKP